MVYDSLIDTLHGLIISSFTLQLIRGLVERRLDDFITCIVLLLPLSPVKTLLNYSIVLLLCIDLLRGFLKNVFSLLINLCLFHLFCSVSEHLVHLIFHLLAIYDILNLGRSLLKGDVNLPRDFFLFSLLGRFFHFLRKLFLRLLRLKFVRYRMKGRFNNAITLKNLRRLSSVDNSCISLCFDYDANHFFDLHFYENLRTFLCIVQHGIV